MEVNGLNPLTLSGGWQMPWQVNGIENKRHIRLAERIR
jgi:hypothetical protein